MASASQGGLAMQSDRQGQAAWLRSIYTAFVLDCLAGRKMIPQVPIPDRMKSLPLDRRGYPVPVIVEHDHAGIPLFAVNRSELQVRCARKKLCPICGQRLDKALWFVGGPGSAFHPYGCYADTAMHHDCMTYAMQVCPYLAMPNSQGMDLEAAIPHLQKRVGKLLVDFTQDPAKPKVFVAVMAYGQSISPSPNGVYVRPLRPYHDVEFWRHGQRVDNEVALDILCGIKDLDMSALRLIKGKS